MESYYSFSSTEFIDNPEILESLGIRGKRIMELAKVDAPILPGFMMPNEAVRGLSKDPEQIKKALGLPINRMDEITDKKFNDPDNPLLIKVVESPLLNIIKSISIHNIGLCRKTLEGFGTFVGEDFAYHEYKNVYAKIIELELKSSEDTERNKKLSGIKEKLVSAKKNSDVDKIIQELENIYPSEIIEDAYYQLAYVISLFDKFFESNATSEDAALLIQTMTFGNYGEESFFGTFYTRNIVTGDNEISGNYFMNEFDATQSKGKSITEIQKPILKVLKKLATDLEDRFKEIRQIRFTVENKKLWIIDQIQVANKSAQAEIKTLLGLHKKGVIDDEYCIDAIQPGRLAEILHPVLDLSKTGNVSSAEGGIAGAVGAAVGKVYFSTDSLLKAYKIASQKNEDTRFILVMPSTFAEDVKAIEVAKGVLTSEGGYASHAPVVARSLGKVALVLPNIKFEKNSIKIGRKTVKEGDYVSLNVPYYEPPAIYFEKLELIEPSPEGSGLLDYLEIVQKAIGDFDVHANADQPKDAELAKKFKATGIGLCRTEHMFFNEKRINIFRSMIIAQELEDREKALAKLKQMQVSDFYQLFKIMGDYPVTIRLLDAPLHEFLPHTKDSMDDFIKFMKGVDEKLTEKEIRFRCDMLKEFNPMLGHRGVRVAISFPEIYNMQVTALFEAAYKLKKEGFNCKPEIMIPLIMSANELKTVRNGKRIEGKAITGIETIEKAIREKADTDPIAYKVGTMIELPAAVLQADKIASYAEFFSFGTNDLTQTTNGLSRDDFNSFFTDYNEFDILENNPFKVLGNQVKEMIKIAAERGRLTRPDIVMGICGEHGAEPENIPFVRNIGLQYVSCSPYGIPIAKLAIAQMNIEKKKVKRG
jgi:pyruvate, orthophosphate dikinase